MHWHLAKRRIGKLPGGGMVIWWSMYIVLVHMRGADEYLDLEGEIELRVLCPQWIPERHGA